MSVQIGKTLVPDGSDTILVVGPLEAAAQVTVSADNSVWMGATAGIETTWGAQDLVMMPSDTGIPLQLNLGAEDALYFGSAPGNGDVHVSWVITN